MRLTTQLLTTETKLKVLAYNSEKLVSFCNKEEEVYLSAMTIAKTDFERRDQLIEAFNDSVLSFAFHYIN